MLSNKRVVGTRGFNYPQLRNFVSLPLQKYEFRKIYDPFKILSYICYRILGRGHPLFGNLHCDFGLNKCDILHFFNAIGMSGAPWVVTFETYLPRWGIHTRFGLEYGVKLLASDSCKRLIAISKCAYDIQCQYLEEFAAYRDDVVKKMQVIHPPQRLLVDNYGAKTLDCDHIVLAFVGHDFFCKGGMEILNAVETLIGEGYPLKLHIVSSMVYGDHASRTCKEDVAKAQKVIGKFPDNIFHYFRLPNDEVLELFKRAHIGLLPTYADTYGYSVLEAQAGGCPVISTNVRALPEINNDEIGWVINVPKDSWGNGLLATERDRARLSGILKESLYETIKLIVENPGMIRGKGVRCLEKVRTFHNPQDKAKEIEAIYDQILDKVGS